jgi:guanine nucleotide-binding protein G(I)/G(S)/G(T) subunit beta-1
MEEIDPQLTTRISKARQETKHLYQQIDKIKLTIQDTTLSECSSNIPALNKQGLNLKPSQILKGHNNKIADFKWAADSKSILSCSQDGFLIIWDPVTGLKLNAIPLDSQWVLSCAYSPNNRLVASAGLTNNCTIYSLPELGNYENAFQQRIVSVFKGHICGITCCDFVDNNSILTGSGDMTCALWDINKSKKVGEYLDHFGDVLSMSIDKTKENVFISGSSDGYARLWDIRTNSVEQRFFVSNSDITSLKFFKDGNSFVSGSDDGVIRLFDLRADSEINRYNLTNAISDLKNSHSSRTIYVQSEASPSYGRPSPTMQHSQQFQTQSIHSSIVDLNSALDAPGVTSLDFSQSGRLMFSCYSEQGCIIWDTLKAEIVGKLEGHSNRVVNVASSPNGFGVCTASWDTTMRIWTPSYA